MLSRRAPRFAAAPVAAIPAIPAVRKSRRSFGFLLALKLVFDAFRRYCVVEGNAEAIQKRELGGLAIYLARMPEAAGPLSPTWAGIALAL